MRNIALSMQVMVGVILGILFSWLYAKLDLPYVFIVHYIQPFGLLFLNGLKIISVPFVFISLVLSITSIQDTRQFSGMVGKSILIYTITTIFSACIGIFLSNKLCPGCFIADQVRTTLLKLYGHTINQLTSNPSISLDFRNNSSLQFLATLIPENFFDALTNNKNLLQVVICAILFGISLLKIPFPKRQSMVHIFEIIRECMIQYVAIMMKIAPIGVFSLISSCLLGLLVSTNEISIATLCYALCKYIVTVISGLFIIVFGLYPVILKLFTHVTITKFFKAIYPAQLVAFSSSSSSVSLSTLMTCVEHNLGIPKWISRFVLPLGSTINMNGTALYQAVVCIFAAQVIGMNLSLYTQFCIVSHIILASIGTAGTPGSGLVMVIALLQSLGIPTVGLTLVLAPEFIIDMFRTVVNITGDALAAVVVAETEVSK